MKLRIQVEGRSYDVDVETVNSGRDSPERRAAETEVPESVIRPRPPQKLPEDSICRSPIAGRISVVYAVNGQTVRRNEPVLLIEAMKMEIPIGPAVDGTIKSMSVSPGDTVAAHQPLFEMV